MESQAYDEYGYSGKWLTLKNGEHIFIRKGETFESALLRRRLTRLANGIPRHVDGFSPAEQIRSKMTPEEKIASVHIDFGKDNVLPELNEDALDKIGLTENKSVLLKSQTIKRNLQKHFDVSDETLQKIITEALYNPVDIYPANPNNPNYYHFAAFIEIEDKSGLKMGLVLLDIDVTKKYFEIGHAYFVDGKGFEKSKNKA